MERSRFRFRTVRLAALSSGAVAVCVALSACTGDKGAAPSEPALTGQAEDEAASAAPDGGTATDPCGATLALRLMGTPDTPALRERLKRALGHDRIRFIHPGDVVTQDLRPDRLNVMIGDDGRIGTARCG